MPATIMTITKATVKFALGATEPVDWSTEEDFSCQVQTASVDATDNVQDVDATWCQGPTQTVAEPSFTVNLTGLQDWTQANGLSMFLFTNRTLEGWVQLIMPNTDVAPTAVAVCHVRFTPGSFGGAAGTPLTFTAALPCQGTPDFTQNATTVLAESERESAAA